MGHRSWIPAEATVVESRVRAVDLAGKPVANSKAPTAFSDAVIRFTWLDQAGILHTRATIAPEDSPFFQLIEGDSFSISFNPQNPDEFEIAGLARDQAISSIKRIAIAVVIVAIGIVVWFGPDLLIAFSKK